MTPGLNFRALALSRLRNPFDEYVVHGALTPLSQGIARTKETIDRRAAEGGDAYEDLFLDSDLDLIENLLGCAFVTCQVFSTAVVSRVKDLHDIHQRSGGAPLTTTAQGKVSILQFGSPMVAGSRYTQLQVIDAFANFFKHRDEWRTSWSSLSGSAAHTAAVITAAGAQDGSTGNLRAGAAAIGDKHITDVSSWGSLIVSWKDALGTAYHDELRALGYVP